MGFNAWGRPAQRGRGDRIPRPSVRPAERIGPARPACATAQEEGPHAKAPDSLAEGHAARAPVELRVAVDRHDAPPIA
eukprot:4809124-Alexandrium_andersonii.AAC.1